MEPSTFFIDREFKFKKSKLEELKDSENGCMKSPIYQICNFSDVKYYLVIYPNGNNEKNRGRTSIFLYVDLGSATNVESKIQYTVESQNFKSKIYEDMYIESFAGWGFSISTTSKFFDVENKFFVDGEITVKVKGSFKINSSPKTKYPIYGKWKINENELKDLKTSKKHYLMSKYFYVSPDSDIIYFFILYPNGFKNDRGNALIYLQLKLGSVSKIYASIIFSIESSNQTKYLNLLYEKNEGQGLDLCSTEEFFDLKNGYFVDGELSIKVSGTLMVEKEKEPTILALEKGIVQKGYHRGKNFTIVVGDKSIKVHKHVLKSASPVFARMFESNLKEVKEKKMNIIDFEYEIVHAAMKLLYSTPLPQTFTFEQMLDLLQFSDKYEIDLIKDAVQDYLIKRISPTNVCSLINATTTFINAPKLLSKCKKYMIDRLTKKEAVHGLDLLEKDVLINILQEISTRYF